MAKLELTDDEINEILECTIGTNLADEITFKLAAAAGSILDVFGDEPSELLTKISEELTADNNRTLMAYAIELYHEQSKNF